MKEDELKMFRNTLKGLMKDTGYYSLHQAELKNIDSMNIPQLIRYCIFCFGLSIIGILFLINTGAIRFG